MFIEIIVHLKFDYIEEIVINYYLIIMHVNGKNKFI